MKSALVFLITFGFSISSFATDVVRFELSSQPTPSREGYMTWQLTAISDIGDILWFDFSGDFGFFGPMNQVYAVGPELKTTFRDYNGLFPLLGYDVRQDSQFSFLSNEVVSLRNPFEGLDRLQARFGLHPSDIGPVFPIAQIVTYDIMSIEYSGLVQILPFGAPHAGHAELHYLSGVLGVPEPSGFVLICVTSALALCKLIPRCLPVRN